MPYEGFQVTIVLWGKNGMYFDIERAVSEWNGYTVWYYRSYRTFNLTLYEGWNLISITLILPNSSVSYVFGDKVTTVYEWDAVNKKYVEVDKIEPGKGYWVYATENCFVVLHGASLWEVNITLYDGWNLIGSIIVNNTVDGNVSNAYYVWDPLEKRYVAKDYIAPGEGAWALSYGNQTAEIIPKE